MQDKPALESSFLKTNAEVEGLRGEMRTKMDSLESKVDQMDGKINKLIGLLEKL